MLIQINSNKTTIERRKPVIIDSIYYESISEASQKTGLNRRLIRKRCHDKTRFENFSVGLIKLIKIDLKYLIIF